MLTRATSDFVVALINLDFFDDHAKWTSPGAIWTSADLSGCMIIHYFPAPTANLLAAGRNTGLCDNTMAVCGAGTPESYSNRYTGADPNLCNAPCRRCNTLMGRKTEPDA